jgi:hypothetical protein
MKKLLIASLLLFVIALHAQDNSKIPAAAKISFAKDFPSVANIKWDKEDGNYEVDFIQDGKKMSALYDAKGMLKETETAIAASELPAAVMPYFNDHYKNVTVKETAKITKANKEINYEIGIKGKDLLFDALGKFIKEAKD